MIKEFQELGLSYYESKALEVILKKQVDAKQLSREAKIPAGKVYSVIKLLVKKGVIDETEERPKKFYIKNLSKIFGKLIEEKQSVFEKSINEIRESIAEIEQDKEIKSKFIDIGVTLEDNKRIQSRIFNESKEEVLQIFNLTHNPQINRKSKTLWESEIEKAVRRGVVFKAIYPLDVKLPDKIIKIIKKYPENFKIKRINTNFTRCDIIDNKKVLLKLSYEDPLLFGGVIFIENEMLAKNLNRIFDDLWEKAE